MKNPNFNISPLGDAVDTQFQHTFLNWILHSATDRLINRRTDHLLYSCVVKTNNEMRSIGTDPSASLVKCWINISLVVVGQWPLRGPREGLGASWEGLRVGRASQLARKAIFDIPVHHNRHFREKFLVGHYGCILTSIRSVHMLVRWSIRRSLHPSVRWSKEVDSAH